MRKPVLFVVFAFAVALAGNTSTASSAAPGPKNYRANLEGFQENPSLSTTGRGHLSLRIDDEAQTIEYELAYGDLEGVGTTPFVTDGVVLFGGGGKAACPTPAGTFTGVIAPADIVGPPLQGINPGEATAFEELVRSIRAGYAYANVHTTRWGMGEIRGQIRVGEGQ